MTDEDGDGLVEPTGDATDTPAERGRSLRHAATLTAGVGIAFSVLFLVAFLLTTGLPSVEATDQEILEYYGSGDKVLPVVIGLYLLPFSGIAFLWFIVALRMWSAASVRRQSVLQSNLQLVSGVIFVAMFFCGAAATTVLAISVQFTDAPIDPVTARLFPTFGQTIILFFAMRMAAMFVFTTSGIGRSAGILPRWFAWVGFGVGVFLLFAATFSPLLVLVFPAWVLALSLILLRKAREIPRELRLPPRVGAGMMNPLGSYGQERGVGPDPAIVKDEQKGP